ncbi:DNA-formamidopyrimidine glycosylase family protein [Rothia nasimurium]|uniref:DNA-formamidopyrimidine glycosylase family protein n=1 Tax=Rothia nasimurium TaxID=85336 RepID=UPI001F1C4DDE|nr:DNA-formamidopyrimidine glycosylase family protein [Rothia nasimurium]
MPEGDTVWRQARDLHRALATRTAHKTDFRYPDLGDVNLAGQPIHGALARGKNILVRVGDMTIHSHLKMEGIWHLYGVGADGRPEPWRRPASSARAVIQANARTDATGQLIPGSTPVAAVGFNLGLLDVFPTELEKQKLAHLGPDLLGPDWSAEQATTRLLARPERMIGPALLDQKNLAGIGTIYRAETLFLTGIDPRTPVGAIPDVGAVVATARLLLDANRARPHRVTRTSAEPLWCYGRAGRPCYRCGASIIREDLSDSGTGADRYTPGHVIARDEDIDRLSFRCPGCQELLG